MKRFIKLFAIIICLIPFFNVYGASETVPSANNIPIGTSTNGKDRKNEYLNQLQSDKDIKTGTKGDRSVLELLYTIAKDIKTVMYILAGVYFLIITIKLIISDNTEEEVTKFKNGIIWITLGIVLMQLAFYIVNSLYAREFGGALASNFTNDIIKPIIKIMETATAFLFILIAIYSYYRVVTANGDEQKITTGRMSIFYALIGFVVVKLAKEIVFAVYGQIDCKHHNSGGIFQFNGSKCIADNQLDGVIDIVVRVINWMNSFVGIIVIIVIIYAGSQVLFSNGDEEKLGKAKKSIIYILIGIAILAFNFLILTFFIIPEVPYK